MGTLLIKNGLIINEGFSTHGDILIKNGRIEKIAAQIDEPIAATEIIAEGQVVMPGIIDDQVHFREPGLTHKANIGSESKAALAGGVTTFMEMPNTKPPALTQKLLQDKYDIAAQSSFTNYSFFMGASNENAEEVLLTNGENICGVKIFMGSSTGNMLVDDTSILDKLFAEIPLLIATHCEDEQTIRRNQKLFSDKYGTDLHARNHPQIRSREGCLLSSSLAVELATKHNTRLHILHISTADELRLFRNDIPLSEKRITAEVCVHHLYFNSGDYETLGNKIKCNPAIKSKEDQQALLRALLTDKLDIIATDHAPHLLEEKNQHYSLAPSGLPLVQHSLTLMLDFYHRNLVDLPTIVHKMCHAPAICFKVRERGFLREGYHADILLVDIDKPMQISRDNILYKCGWSPLEGRHFRGAVNHVLLNGQHILEKGVIKEGRFGQRVLFDR